MKAPPIRAKAPPIRAAKIRRYTGLRLAGRICALDRSAGAPRSGAAADFRGLLSRYLRLQANRLIPSTDLVRH
jgi:type IV secretion system protein VirD4